MALTVGFWPFLLASASLLSMILIFVAILVVDDVGIDRGIMGRSSSLNWKDEEQIARLWFSVYLCDSSRWIPDFGRTVLTSFTVVGRILDVTNALIPVDGVLTLTFGRIGSVSSSSSLALKYVFDRSSSSSSVGMSTVEGSGFLLMLVFGFPSIVDGRGCWSNFTCLVTEERADPVLLFIIISRSLMNSSNRSLNSCRIRSNSGKSWMFQYLMKTIQIPRLSLTLWIDCRTDWTCWNFSSKSLSFKRVPL